MGSGLNKQGLPKKNANKVLLYFFASKKNFIRQTSQQSALFTNHNILFTAIKLSRIVSSFVVAFRFCLMIQQVIANR